MLQMLERYQDDVLIGLAFFVLDVLLLVIALPILLNAIDRRRWKMMRARIVRQALDYLLHTATLAAGMCNGLARGGPVDRRDMAWHFCKDLYEARERFSREMDFLAPAFEPSMADPVPEIRQELLETLDLATELACNLARYQVVIEDDFGNKVLVFASSIERDESKFEAVANEILENFQHCTQTADDLIRGATISRREKKSLLDELGVLKAELSMGYLFQFQGGFKGRTVRIEPEPTWEHFVDPQRDFAQHRLAI